MVTFPDAVTLKRFAIPLCVFCLGIANHRAFNEKLCRVCPKVGDGVSRKEPPSRPINKAKRPLIGRFSHVAGARNGAGSIGTTHEELPASHRRNSRSSTSTQAADRYLGVKTIPLSFGSPMDIIAANSESERVKKTLKLAYISLILSFLMACFLVFCKNYSFWTLFKIGLSLLITYFVIKQTDAHKGDYFYLFCVDGMMLLQSLIVILL